MSYNIISLPSLALKDHTYVGDKDGVTVKLKREKTIRFPLIGKLCHQYGYRPKVKGRVIYPAYAVFDLGQAKAPTIPTYINTFHCTYGHTHEVLLKKTAEQQGVNLSGELREFFRGGFGKQCRKRGIKQEFTLEDSPKSNGVAERALELIKNIQAPVLYPSTRTYPSLWAEAVSWARHVLDCIATPANSGDKSPYEMWYCLTPSPRGVCGRSSSQPSGE